MATIERSAEVRAAQEAGGAVVALESTLLCHGFPKPHGAQMGVELEQAVRAQGAVPATIAVLAGRIHVGLDPDQLQELARRDDVEKCSVRDLPVIWGSSRWGATTVAATCAIAAQAGIEVFATGGIGGVHRGGERSLDVSADLPALARYPVAVVSAGAKALLDLPRTLEVLETLSVPVIGYGTDDFPAFYSRTSGCAVRGRVDDVSALARAWRNQRSLGGAGMLVCNPVPQAEALPAAEVEAWIALALERAGLEGIAGPRVTPFVLEALRGLSGGRTLLANRALALSNARLAGRLAAHLVTPPGSAMFGVDG